MGGTWHKLEEVYMPDDQFRADMGMIKAEQDAKIGAKADKEQARKDRASTTANKKEVLTELRSRQANEKAALVAQQSSQKAELIIQQSIDRAEMKRTQDFQRIDQRQRHNMEKLDLQTS